MSDGLVLYGLRIDLDRRRLDSPYLTIASGEILAVMGPPGSGKSTLLAEMVGARPLGFEVSSPPQ